MAPENPLEFAYTWAAHQASAATWHPSNRCAQKICQGWVECSSLKIMNKELWYTHNSNPIPFSFSIWSWLSLGCFLLLFFFVAAPSLPLAFSSQSFLSGLLGSSLQLPSSSAICRLWCTLWSATHLFNVANSGSLLSSGMWQLPCVSFHLDRRKKFSFHVLVRRLQIKPKSLSKNHWASVNNEQAEGKTYVRPSTYYTPKSLSKRTLSSVKSDLVPSPLQ